MSIWDLEPKILNSVPLLPEEMRLVEEAVASNRIAEKVLACEALLRLGNLEQRNHAARVISNIVHDSNAGRESLDPSIVMTFFSLPIALFNESAFQLCLKRAASHDDEGVRANSMVVLGRLARIGAGWATELLEAGRKDSSGIVRQNAEANLRLSRD